MSSLPLSKSAFNPSRGLCFGGVAGLVATVLVSAAGAGEIVAEVKDGRGAVVADAVVSATPLSGSAPARPQTAVIAHQNQQFVPFVTAVQIGALINLPNRDAVKHHAYSFSPAKKFELPLYAGTPDAPLRFDQPGIVTIGCNIHDWMTAYVCVLETPFFAITGKDGRAQLRSLPAGNYRVEVWQPRLKTQPSAAARQIAVGASPAQVDFAVDLKPDFRARRNPASGVSTYR